MENEIKNLKLEIDVLKKRISTLERIENRRKIIKIIKISIILIILGIIIYFGYKWYNEMINYFNQIKDFMNNPLKSIIPKG